MSDYASNNNSTDSSSGGGTLDRYFKISERGSTVATEIRAGITTFLTMGYILFINPQILSLAGIPAADVAIATALGAAIATIIMGLYANFPFVLAPGMGLENADCTAMLHLIERLSGAGHPPAEE